MDLAKDSEGDSGLVVVEFRVQGPGFRVQVQGSGSRVQGSRFRV